MGQKVKVDRDGHVLLIGMNRPDKGNAIDLEMYYEMAAAYGELDQDPELWCGVLYAEGKHFCTGLDLAEWAPEFASGKLPVLPVGYVDPYRMNEEKRLSKPLIAAAQGYCYTIGIEVLLATDVRIGANNLKLIQFEVQRGIYPVCGATVRMPEEIGWGNAMRYLLTGDVMSAEEAYRMGMIQELCEPGQQLEKAVELAQRIARQAAPLGVQATIRSAHRARIHGNQAALDLLWPEVAPIMQSEDAKEGVQSFVERREARFKGC